MENLKRVIIIGCFGIIMLLGTLFIISAGVVAIIFLVVGLAIAGLYSIWEKFAKEELVKKKKILIF